MTITSVSSSSFLADTVNLIRNKIASNVTDPILSIRPSREKFCLTSYPKRAVTYPIITVVDAGITQQQKLGMASEGTLININIEIRIWARDVKERDELFDSIYNYFRTNQLDSGTGLVDSNLNGFSLTSAVNVSEEKVQSKVMEVKFLFVCS